MTYRYVHAIEVRFAAVLSVAETRLKVTKLMSTKIEMSKIEFCEHTQRSSESLPRNGKAHLNAGGDAKSGEVRSRRRHWEAALWAFAIVGWSVLVYLYHSHPPLP